MTRESFTALVGNAALLLSLVDIYDQLNFSRRGVSGTVQGPYDFHELLKRIDRLMLATEGNAG